MDGSDFGGAQRAVFERYGLRVDERWLDIDVVDGRAHVVAAGRPDDAPVLFLNGIGLPAAMFAPLMTRLDVGAHHAVDLPGYGQTDCTATFVDDLRPNAVRFLIELLDRLGLDRPIIVSNSLGSLWATWFAIDRPERVAGLVHVGWPATAVGTSAPLPMRLLSVRPLGRLLTQIQPPSRRQVTAMSKMVGEHPLPPEMTDLIVATERLTHYRPTFLATLHHLLRLRGNRPDRALGREDLARVEAPTLVVVGRDDPFCTPAHGSILTSSMPDARLATVDGGHAPWMHHADQIAPMIDEAVRAWARPRRAAESASPASHDALCTREGGRDAHTDAGRTRRP